MSLEGRTVLVTRPVERADPLVALLEERGATALIAPAIRYAPPRGKDLERAVARTAEGGFAWVVFTSAATVSSWFERASGPIPAKVAAVGPATRLALEEHGVAVDLVPPTFTTAALGDAFPPGTGSVLLPRADVAPPELQDALEAKGWTPVRVEAYRTLPAGSLPDKAARALAEGRVDAVTFTSASTVDGFVAAAGPVEGPKVVCIGPVTAEAARAAGMTVHAVADPHTTEGLVAAVERALRPF
ncbi:MAG TPA: uroporphyrinogen-III synthase [Actinomycetota bacterium]